MPYALGDHYIFKREAAVEVEDAFKMEDDSYDPVVGAYHPYSSAVYTHDGLHN